MSYLSIPTSDYWVRLWTYFVAAHDYDYDSLPFAGWPLLAGASHHLVVPVTKAVWDDYVWDRSAGDHIRQKPTWSELLAPMALFERTQIPLRLDKLHAAYVRQVEEHIPAIEHQADIHPLIDALRAAGRAKDADNAQHWAMHLFFRWQEMKHGLVNGNDETQLGIGQCLSDYNRHGPWDFTEAWEGPTFRFHPSLPPYQKPDSVLANIGTIAPAPSGVTIVRRDGTTLAVISSSPASVSFSHPSGFFELEFVLAGEKTVAARVPDTPEIINVSWTAYGETHQKKIDLSPADSSA